jgi:hypothetical protein
MLALEDLKEMKQKDVIKHLSTQYAGTESGFSYREPKEVDFKDARKKLSNMKVLIAYESVGSYGCDSSSFFLLQNKKTNELFEVHGSHCSCYGFEGQLLLEPTTIEALKARNETGVFYCGGYDYNETENQMLVKEYIAKL